MASFLSESYLKPKLIEPHLINKIIEEQNNKITFEKKIISYVKNFIIQYWKMIIVLLIISGSFYWRYKEIKKIRNNYLNKNKKTNETVFTKSSYSQNQYEDDSDTDS